MLSSWDECYVNFFLFIGLRILNWLLFTLSKVLVRKCFTLFWVILKKKATFSLNLKVACVVKIKLFFMDWLYYNFYYNFYYNCK